MRALADLDPSCAICGVQKYPECPHESERLQLAVSQAIERWEGMRRAREWVLNHARNEVLCIFQELRGRRYQAYMAYLQTLPCYTLYQRHNGNPPQIHPMQLQSLHKQINDAQEAYRSGVDEDWRRSCMKYPEFLDHFFTQVDIDLADDGDSSARKSRYGGRAKGSKKTIKARDSSRGSTDASPVRRKKGRRGRSRGRTPGRR